MAQAIRIHENGGPEAMRWETVDVGSPGPGEVRIRHTAIGVNFIDVYFRTGLYKNPAGLPFTLGNEGAGIVEEIGEGVRDLAVGDHVVYASAIGSYCTERLAPADRMVRIPAGISDETAAAMLLKGMTARYLLRKTFRVDKGHTILVHAAAGGVGSIMTQWAAHLGATVIGTVGSPAKAELARANGCHHTILYSQEDFVARVNEITGGKKCDVVYDSIGKNTFPGSLDCLKPLGMWVSFGNASGPVPDFSLQMLAARGSLFATRPTLFSYTAERADLLETANDLFDVVQRGVVKIEIGSRVPLAEAARAHRELEARQTTGSTILVP